jgi:L,D-peptidoglycan transpeptidase YkuD (ErfK/YbiS/YcfS/YnhG family)
MTINKMVYGLGRLRAFGREIPVSCGRSGVTDKKVEGDGATPRGIHHITGLYYRPDRLSPPSAWAKPMGLGDLWCDDPNHPLYNHLCHTPFYASHETLRRSDPQYDIVITTDWNWPNPVAGQGSAIFLHQWRRPLVRTAGCIAMSRYNLIWLAKRARIGTRLTIG